MSEQKEPRANAQGSFLLGIGLGGEPEMKSNVRPIQGHIGVSSANSQFDHNGAGLIGLACAEGHLFVVFVALGPGTQAALLKENLNQRSFSIAASGGNLQDVRERK